MGRFTTTVQAQSHDRYNLKASPIIMMMTDKALRNPRWWAWSLNAPSKVSIWSHSQLGNQDLISRWLADRANWQGERRTSSVLNRSILPIVIAMHPGCHQHAFIHVVRNPLVSKAQGQRQHHQHRCFQTVSAEGSRYRSSASIARCATHPTSSRSRRRVMDGAE